MALDLLKNILDDEFLENLAKSADLYKIGSNSVLDPEEIRIGLKVVPRAVMSMLISELAPMNINTHKDIHLPFGKTAYISANKNAADDYTGSVYNDNKLVYDFKNRSIPGLGLILLSTFELYDVEDLTAKESAVQSNEDIDRKVQKLIDERMELHSLVNKVVEDKMAQREALHKLMMMKLNEAIAKEHKKNADIAEVRKIQESSTPQSDPYFRGMTNGIEVANAIANEKEPRFVETPKKPIEVKAGDVVKKETGHETGIHGSSSEEPEHAGESVAGNILRYPHGATKENIRNAHKKVLGEMKEIKPNLPKSEQMIKKELPLKKFLDRKKKPKEYSVEMAKSETVSCDSCGQIIFGSGGFAGCICFGQDQHRKIWLKKNDDGVQIRFSRGWDEQNIEMLLETLRSKNGRN